jgi:hypothetical protein
LFENLNELESISQQIEDRFKKSIYREFKKRNCLRSSSVDLDIKTLTLSSNLELIHHDNSILFQFTGSAILLPTQMSETPLTSQIA